jgi:hypothetical protein
MDKRKLVVGAAKLGIGLVTSVLIGVTIKQEKRVVDMLTNLDKPNTTV